MAYDNKRLRTMKWLESLCSAKKERLNNILVYCGAFYATDDIILAKVEYPEFNHLSDWEWSKIVRYCDDDSYLMQAPEIEVIYPQFRNDRIFDDMFIRQWHRLENSFDPKQMKRALKGFEINRINPHMAVDERKIELTGHNDDVSMRVLFMSLNK